MLIRYSLNVVFKGKKNLNSYPFTLRDLDRTTSVGSASETEKDFF